MLFRCNASLSDFLSLRHKKSPSLYSILRRYCVSLGVNSAPHHHTKKAIKTQNWHNSCILFCVLIWCRRRVKSEKQLITVFREWSQQSKEKLKKAKLWENFDYATWLGNLQIPRKRRKSLRLSPHSVLHLNQIEKENGSINKAQSLIWTTVGAGDGTWTHMNRFTGTWW